MQSTLFLTDCRYDWIPKNITVIIPSSYPTQGYTICTEGRLRLSGETHVLPPRQLHAASYCPCLHHASWLLLGAVGNAFMFSANSLNVKARSKRCCSTASKLPFMAYLLCFRLGTSNIPYCMRYQMFVFDMKSTSTLIYDDKPRWKSFR